MEFPVTRQYLKEFNREFYIAEKERLGRYDFYMTLIKKISTGVEQTLLNSKIPITQYVWKDIGVIGHWKNIMNQLHIKSCIDRVEFYKRNYGIGTNHQTDETLNKYLPEFISLLKENFIDCDIIVDPLKTYLIIDWS